MAQSKVPKSMTRASDETKQAKFGAREDKDVAYTESVGNARKSKSNPREDKEVPPAVAKAREGGQPKKVDESVPNLRTNDSHQRRARRSINSADDNAKPHALKSVPIEQSPIHPRTGGRGSGSQPSSSDSLQGASGRPRSRPNARQASNHPGGGPAVPEFGAWNRNPEQAEGYTDVFNQVITDRRTPGNNPANVAATPRRIPNQESKGNCFSRLFKCFSSAG